MKDGLAKGILVTFGGILVVGIAIGVIVALLV